MSVDWRSLQVIGVTLSKTEHELFRVAAIASFMFFAFHSASAQDVQKSTAKRPPAATSPSGGHRTFESTCAPCHGLDGKGGERAPDIATRPEVTRLSDPELLKILRAGIPEKGMPPFAALGPAKLSALLSYVRSLQGKGTETPVAGNTARGKELFWGKAGCADCHMVNGAGGFLGRDLSNYGENHSATEIRAAIVKPEITAGTHGHVADVTTAEDGKSYSGLVRNEDNFSLQLQSLDGTFHLFSKSDLAAITFRQESLMPADYGSKFSGAELDALAAYVASIARTKQKRGDEFEY
jgi:cytochrome c oxidase cbb3-type subunit 3